MEQSRIPLPWPTLRFIRPLAIPFLLLLASSCGEENLILIECVEEDDAFDIEEVSVLEDATATAGMHDAVLLDYDTSALPKGAIWRVGRVDVLVMIEKALYDHYPPNTELMVEVFDSDNLLQSRPYQVTRTINKDAYDWETVELASGSVVREYYQTWLAFSFSEKMPTKGMSSSRFAVGVHWPQDLPTIGYSNYNRDCSKNWTDYGDGLGWQLNSDRGSVFTCSWPMLRVATEIVTKKEEC